MIVQLDTLPSSVLDLIPLSLRVNKTSLTFEDLPNDLQIKLRLYITTTQNVRVTTNVRDYSSDFSEFSDWVELTDDASLILEYAKNWFLIRQGAYPYDPTFGTVLYKILHMKDTQYQNQLLQNELSTLVRLIENEFSTTIAILKKVVQPVEYTDHTEYRLELQLKILGRVVTLNAYG